MKSIREYRYSKGWIVLLATAVGLSYGGYTYINRAVTSQVYVTNCGMQDYKPTTIIKFCADAGVGVGAIEWSSWSAEGATGEGKYEINDCIPTCVAGKLHSADVTVVLSKSKTIAGKPTLTHIVVKTKDGKNLPLSDSPTDAWPMELAG
ncbi:unannotated protein [freshwater metagenome]|uniref:Unannotated protein n=1 Tax=freshwater metagenome TaxID=449393 RepID=A0A6J6QBC0_9ZZZZ|nr:hypothetical protein [Actinomycetota bacterium]MSX45990.1 hypothetical protein [Actinomycetota bacterium]MSX73712.1 hypothetical protein [Actinomycetota bacterium]MSZ00992.1 hypothetical protein [Actinomycetota bacterium]MTA60083.1 hypothetical protein [Actinomycetota bacterium]